ncbi:MAG: flagellar protein [Methylococcales bacterium]|nr:flagellar protein [Methylococcales bacterium]MBT7444421.1 flagellar protein [Methylococcales bacterium]
MADEDLDLDLSEGDEESGGKKKLIIIIVAAVILIGGAAAFFLMGGEDTSTDPDAAEESTEEAVDEGPISEVPIFAEIQPSFVVAFTSKRKVRYLQVSLSVVSRKQKVIDAVNFHMPVISNDVSLLIGMQKFSALKTTKGKNALRAALLAEIQRVVKENSELEGIDNVYYTSFIMQ